MKPVTQSRTGADGTCFRACLASIFELKESDVPDFSDEEFFKEIDDYLATLGLCYRRRPIDGVKPSGWSTIEGVSPRGGLHACVAYDGVLVYDPHPQDGTGRGLVEPRYYGLLETTGRARAGDARIPKPSRKVMKSSGKVKLLALTQPNTGVVVYAVEYPHKVGGVDIDKTVMAQFMVLSEAEDMYRRMVTYYESKRATDASLDLNKHSMRDILDMLGIDIKEYMRRTETQKNALLRTAVEQLDRTLQIQK